MLVDLEYYFLYGSFGLEIFHTCKKHKNVFAPKISWAKTISSILGRVSKLAAVTLAAIPCWQILHKFFCISLLDLKFGIHVFNIMMMVSPNFHGKITIQQIWGGCQSWQQCKTLSLELLNGQFECHPIVHQFLEKSTVYIT